MLRPPGSESHLPPGHDVRPSTLPRRALDQVLDSAGVVQTEGVDHLLDVVDAIERQGLPLGPRVGLLSNTAALGASLRGAADRAGLEIVADNRRVPLSPDRRLVQRAFTSMAALGEVDLVIAGVLDAQSGELEELLRQMAVVARHSEVVMLVCVVTAADRFGAALREAVRSIRSAAGPREPPRRGARRRRDARAAQRPQADETSPPAARTSTARPPGLVDARLAAAGGEVVLEGDDVARAGRLPHRPALRETGSREEDALAAPPRSATQSR